MATMKTLNGYGFDSAKLGGKAPEYYIQPRNLLDNSDFRNPVNQRGAGGSYDAWGGYNIDRWATYKDGATVNLTSQGLSLHKSIYQPIGADTMLRYNGKHLTYAVKIDGVVYVASGLFEQTGVWHRIQKVDTPYGHIILEVENDNSIFCVINNNISAATIEWAALYEGSYTADTLPPYVPKGYAVELAECDLYYRPLGYNVMSVIAMTSSDGGVVLLKSIRPMRDGSAPTIINNSTLYAIVNGVDYTLTDVRILRSDKSGVEILANASGAPSKQTAMIHGSALLALSRDL